ncbi:MAG: hypothetical protein WKF92_15120 [Pyrinomonadaceae bacterium]
MQIGYIRTRGTGLLQIVDGNPCRPGFNCRGVFGNRVNPSREVIQLYTNAASSTYDALQVSLTKRLGNNFSAGLHYTWSSFMDDAHRPVSDATCRQRGSKYSSVGQSPAGGRSNRIIKSRQPLRSLCFAVWIEL